MIIDCKQQLDHLTNCVDGKNIVLVPILEDEYTHPVANPIIGYYILIQETGEDFTVLLNHPEALYNVDIVPVLSKCSKIHCCNKPALLYNRVDIQSVVVDAQLQQYLHTGKLLQVPVNKAAEFYRRRLPIKSSLLIDPVVLQAQARQLAKLIQPQNNICEQFYENMFVEVFHTIEKSGLRVNKQLFAEVFPHSTALVGDYAYTKYNYYTATGRPSNKFGGINFAALNKEDNTREAFVSRYEADGVLFEIDFQSYHPRILADITDYKLSDGENIYQHLAKYYFDTQTPTPEQISESKELTFKQLYGGISAKYKNIEYFAKIDNLTKLLWTSFVDNGYINSFISKRVLHSTNLEDMTPTKLLNYLIQLHETEQNVIFLSSLFKLLDEEIKPILYTYDSVLFDLPKAKQQELQQAIDTVIPSRFPYRTKTGDNYRCLS